MIGVPDAEMGERVVAFVEPAPGVEASPELAAELATFAREHLSGFRSAEEELSPSCSGRWWLRGPLLTPRRPVEVQ